MWQSRTNPQRKTTLVSPDLRKQMVCKIGLGRYEL